MEIEEFLAQYGSLSDKLDELKRKRQVSHINEAPSFDSRIKKLEFMLGILGELKSNNSARGHEKPEKCKPNYYFVSKITDDDIMRSDEPSFQRSCPKCEISLYVLMSYERVFDYGRAQIWEKEAFIICPGCCEIHKLQSFSAAYEF